MPELPEVQTVVDGIKPNILRRKVINFKAYTNKLRYPISRSISEKIVGNYVKNIYRRAKYIILDLNNSQSIVVHLGMSGRIIVLKADKDKKLKHTQFIIQFSKDIELQYIDPRKFGLIKVIPSNLLQESKLFVHLGPEPLSRLFNKSYLKKICNNKNTPIKSIIMNQKYVVGIGNIYASESLFLAKITPIKVCNKLTIKELSLLITSIRKVLRKSIQSGGSSISDYAMVNGKLGNYQNELEVYGREGSICREKSCQSKILRIVIAQRSTFYCPVCQK